MEKKFLETHTNKYTWPTVYTSKYFIFVSHLVAFLLPGIGYTAAVFQVCKICAFNQSNALVLIAKYEGK